ncbi:DUF305 domain-containing protein [Edwardsiella piscicida]|uniref:DUF305 domain-containing protein n=1 Tax=Edwardsiella piscicida TaxID=1263550 RepID=UPI00290AD983|nr:DUF305 domain-containing protein [Edwardsiella piscicida]EKS7812460.1 DUF305 domain-containing protein [Edwardsiella piscicida]ELM3721386.1 DUF305 domain-containing protein [Edwardsiella piscicida]ELM3728179.1 DUF305 domain-containing protein [Edwardsiella piscicida]ELV7537553.1 DUF305 domain-containing protein [Edwardsiella piscicida]
MKHIYNLFLASLFTLLFYLPAAWAQSGGHPHTATPHAHYQDDPAFITKMDKIMVEMHQGMSEVALTGNKDIDFMIMMIPHHQGAIDMSRLILETSQDKEVQNMALSIITEQENEIAIMNQLIKEKKNAH